MSDLAKIFQDMMVQSMEMGKKFAADSDMYDAAAFERMMPGMSKSFLNTAFGNTLNPQGLDAKTRFLIAISALVAQGATQVEPLKLAVKSAMAVDASQQEICEVMVQMAAFGGIPAMTSALEAAREVFADTAKESDA